MKESQKGSTGDHRTLSDPIPERKDFINHVKENATKEESKDKSTTNGNRK